MLAIYSGPTHPENCIGFIQANHDGRFEALDASGNPLGDFADEEAAYTGFCSHWDKLFQSNGGGPIAVSDPSLQPGAAQEGEAQAAGGADSDEQVETHICAQCQLNPPDGSERLSTYNDKWLHPRCQEAFIHARMAEEGLLWEVPPRSMLAAALDYAKRGWDVFPAPPGEKKSLKSAQYSGGAKWGKTRDPEQIRRDFNHWPKANVAIVTGAESGIFVVETDTKKGHDVDGDASLAELEQKHGKLPDTRMAESPSGSKHRYFNHSGEGIKIKNTASMLGHGIDVRGDGGMVIAPPSVRSDGEYRWLNDSPIADAPQWLLDLVTTKPKSNGKGANDPANKLDIADAFKHLAPQQNLAGGIEYPTADIEEIRTAFAVIPNDNRGWDDWNKCGMALFHATGGSDDGLAIFHAWSSKSKKYNAQATADKWADYKTCPPTEIGVGSIFYWANEAAPGWVQERRAKQIAENIKIGDDVTEPLLPQILTLKETNERLVFIGSTGGVADLITGRIRKKEHAADEYAASKHTYVLQNGTLKEVPALKLWTASKDRMTVEVLTWVPGAPQICQPPEGPGPAFNMWRGLSPMAFPESWQLRVEPFLEHVEFLVPIAEERERFLQWLAHIVQRPEVLPHTTYLMTTPVTGIGRNLLASILVRALRGFVAAGISLPEMLDGGFTGRLSMKLLAIVDEAREGSGERRYQRATRLTSMVTEEHRQINPKYGHQSIQKNCCRWLYFSNYDDAIPFDPADRRNSVIANPTIRKPAAYYERLYGLLNDKDFIGSVRHWLEAKDIAAFRPGEHAPMNQAKLRVLNEMMSETERAVAEFKEDCKTELTSRDEIKNHVFGVITRNGRTFANVNDTHLTHAIRGARMLNTGRRIMAYRKDQYATGFHEARFTVVIVRGEWTTETIKKADPNKLLEVMGLKDWSTAKPQR